jgi:hypothetical protein
LSCPARDHRLLRYQMLFRSRFSVGTKNTPGTTAYSLSRCPAGAGATVCCSPKSWTHEDHSCHSSRPWWLCSMAMTQEPIDWRYLPYIRPIF